MSIQPFSSDAGFSTVGNVTGANFIGNVVSTTVSATGNVSAGNLLLSGTTVGYGVIAPTIGSNTSPTTGSISATTAGTATTVLTAAIPAAGTWEITAQINCSLASGQECTFALYDGAGTLVTNTETKAGYIGGGATYQGQGTGIWRVTTVGAVNYTVRAFGPGSVAGCIIQSSGDGRTYVSWSLLSAPVTLNSMTVPTNISVVGNVTGGNVLTSGIVSTAGNVTGNYFIGNGSQLTGLAGKTTGAWSVTAGTNTYSFTVPSNGTYSMWVTGNIPNGIIVWNGIATVTNNNVPVVGQQYGWVYNGAGTPIDFVSLPNQFIGTGNTIVRSNASPSTTTNRFDFSINNTSGSTQTVNYGYITL